MAVQFTRIAVKIGSNVLARKDGTMDVFFFKQKTAYEIGQ